MASWCVILPLLLWTAHGQTQQPAGVDFLTQEYDAYNEQNHRYKLLDKYEQRRVSDEFVHKIRASLQGAVFSGVFSNNSVLQREPYVSAVYGAADTANVGVSLTIKQMDGDYQDTLSANTDANGDWKVLLQDTRPNGGNYTLTVECGKCASPQAVSVLYNVTFGDVYYCSGQSNMELDMHFTFNRWFIGHKSFSNHTHQMCE